MSYTGTQNPHRQPLGHHLAEQLTKRAPGTPSTPAAATRRATKPGRKPTASGFDDLLTMAKLLDQAHTWIAKQMQADAKARKARQEANNSD